MAIMDWSAILVVVCCLISRSLGQNVTGPTCPSSQDIFPCQCSLGENGITLDCQNIVTELELSTIFKYNFRDEILYEFILRDSSLIYIGTNVFGTTAFQRIILKDSLTAGIDDSAFTNSYLTLTYMEVNSININTDPNFPYRLYYYIKLETLHVEDIRGAYQVPYVDSRYLKEVRLMHCLISSIDNYLALQGFSGVQRLYMNWNGLKSLNFAFRNNSDLKFLSLRGNALDSMNEGTFYYLSKVTYLDLSFNKLTSLSFEAGTFSTLTALEHLDLTYNKFVELPPTEFQALFNLQFLNASHNLLSSLDSETFSGNVNLNTIDLDYNNLQVLYDNSFSGMVEQNATIYLRSNNIAYLQTAAFGDTSTSQIHLENNQIPILYETWFRPLLEKENVVYVDGNPYKCDCDFSWILDDPLFVTLLRGSCEDGTPFEDLDAAHFQGC